MRYEQRAQLCQNPTAKQLLELMAAKQTNLAVSLDVTDKAKFLHLADILGPEICVLKTHIDIIDDFDQELIDHLVELSKQHNFIIFEDRKFADIGNTVKLQYSKGVYHIADWASITNAHVVPGPGIIQGLKEIGLPKGNGLLLLAEMSSKGNLATDNYTKATLQMAQDNPDFVIGFITQHRLLDDDRFINYTPGIKLATGGDTLGQQYITPEQAILENGSDIISVGRGIYAADDPQQAAKQYRDVGWAAYQQLCF